MKDIKVWPHLTIIAVLFAALAGVAAGYLVRRHSPDNVVQVKPAAARIKRVDGQVGLDRTLADQGSEQWTEATLNTPVSAGDRIYSRDNSRASIAFSGRNFARLDPNTSLDVLSLSDGRTQLALRDGSAFFDVGELPSNGLFEVGTPYGAVNFNQPGLYQVGFNDNGATVVRVLSGLAQVMGLGGSGQIDKGEMLTLLGQTAAEVLLSRIDPGYAGGLLNDYYGYQYPDIYDGRYTNYDSYLNDPYYYDPANRYTSYRYVPDTVPGIEDLDPYGDWRNVNGYGYAWAPRVNEDWTPYQQGYWTMDAPYGLTWVSSEPWGYAPYHYGRWANVGNQWMWVPDQVSSEPSYSPALVAFVPLQQENSIGWVPLGPGDPYVQRYYDRDWQPRYSNEVPVVQQVVNLGVPGAVTVVRMQDFQDVITPRIARKFDRRIIESTRPVLDPLTVVALKQAALQPAVQRRGFDLPPGIAKKIRERAVFTSTAPSGSPFDDRIARAFNVRPIPEREKKGKLKIEDLRGQGRDDRGSAVSQEIASQGSRNDKHARRDVQQLEHDQKRDERQQQESLRRQQLSESQQQATTEREQRMAMQRAQGERASQQAKAQREQARQQAAAAEQQQRALMQQQAELKRQARQQAEQQQRAVRTEQGRGHGKEQPQQAPQMKQVQPQGARPDRGPGGGGGKEKGGPPADHGGKGKGKGKG